MAAQMLDVVFVVMPFADAARPALGVSLLKSAIQVAGFSARVEYLNLLLAEDIGIVLYQRIASGFPPDLLVGEWFFSDHLFGDDVPPAEDYLAQVLMRKGGADAGVCNDLIRARLARARFIEACIKRLHGLRPKIVGFTTTFHQSCACLAVAKRLKESPDPPLIVFGGANCEGEMGWQLIRSFPWIDYVCSGESDHSFPALVESLLRTRASDRIPGVLSRADSESPEPSLPVRNLDELPTADFHDYFNQLAPLKIKSEFHADLTIETSRGCWWGAKSHCTFCGLNGNTMTFRSKSVERAFEEMRDLVETYGIKRIGCVDNILDMRYITGLFPRLKEAGLDLELFYEVKANLRYDQLALMRDGGVKTIQPGIESLSDEVLRLMKKGTSGTQNLQLLRWSEELGIQVAWNILAGFPGESASEYTQMTEWAPLLTHLMPPASCTPIRLDRFSPFYTDSEKFGFSRLRPAAAYYYAFPLGRKELARLAYYFDFDYADGRDPIKYVRGLQAEVQGWWESRSKVGIAPPQLDARWSEEGVHIEDTRKVATARHHHLTGPAARIYELCDSALSLPGLVRALGDDADETAIREILAGLSESRLILEMKGQYLSLAVFRRRPPISAATRVHAKLLFAQTAAA
jgi:ribosomal peptide maturation radical SAM protein 1